MRNIWIFLNFLLLTNYQIKSQDWVRIYGNNMLADAPWVIETYDKGYLILDNSHDYLWLIKTDINGYELWEKWIGTGHDAIQCGNIEQTSDGGYVLGGAFSKYDPNEYDPVIIKLDPCGELQWCSVIYTPGRYDYATRVKPTPEGNYILLTVYCDPSYTVNLFKFDGSGNKLWKQNYHPDSLISDEYDYDVRVDNDGYLITSQCYYPDPGNPNIDWERPYFIKTDTAGNLTWWLVYGSGNGYHGIGWDQTIKSSTGNYYGYGWHSNYCDTPGLFKCLGNGQESYYQDLIPGACAGGAATVTFLNDTTLVAAAGGTLNNVYVQYWMKTDTMGISTYYVEYPETWMTNTQHTVKTFDNKFVSVSEGGDIWIYLYKLNSNLNFDSIYTHQYTYDSLCPGGVRSDTINPNCDLIVGIQYPKVESELYQLKVYPNPASVIVNVKFPEYLEITGEKSGMSSSSVYYQWKSSSLEVYNIEGKKVFEREIPKSQQQLEMEISNWQKGLYYFRLVCDKQTVASEKVIIQ